MEPKCDQDIIKTMWKQNVCLCCLAKNVQFVTLRTCKHTSFFEFFFKFKFQYQNSVICNECHYHLKRIELFKSQVEESLSLLWSGQPLPAKHPKMYQNFVCTEPEYVANIDDPEDGGTNIIIKTEPESCFADENFVEFEEYEFEEQNPLADNTKETEYGLQTELKIEEKSQDSDTPLSQIVTVNLRNTKVRAQIKADTRTSFLKDDAVHLRANSLEGGAQNEKNIRGVEVPIEHGRVRSSALQFAKMLEFMECHGDLAASKPHHGVMGKQRAERLWGDLTNSLNNMTGGFKTMEQWKKTWIDWKNKTKKKQQYNQNHPSGKPKPFSAMEERVLAISCRFLADQHWLYGDQSVESPKSSETISVIYPKESETEPQSATIIYQMPSETTSSKTVSVMYQKPSESTSQPASIKQQKPSQNTSQSGSIKYQKAPETTSQSGSVLNQKGQETMSQSGSVINQKASENISQPATIISQKPSETTSQPASIIYQMPSETTQPAEVPIEFEEVLLEKLMDDEVIPEADANSTNHNITGEEQILGESTQSMDTQQSSDLQAESECEMINEEATAAESENKTMYLSRIRPTAEQLELLLQYIDRHGDPVHWSRHTVNTAANTVVARRLKADQMWIDLTDALNAIGNRKTIGKWKKTWVDWKSKTKKKLQNSGYENLSSYERRLIAVLARAKKKLEAKSEEQIAAIKEFLGENASESGRGLTPSLDDQPADGEPSESQPSVEVPVVFESVLLDEAKTDEQKSALETKKKVIKEIVKLLKASVQQLLAMVEFMERKGDPSKWFSSNRVKLWATLTVTLNDIPGYDKHMEQWEQVWHTWKDHTKQKLQTTDKASLTSLEQRLLKITGHTEELINKDQSVTEEREVCETIPTEKPQPTNLVRVEFLNSFELSDEEVTEGNGTKERETKKMGHELRSRSSVEQLGVMLKYFERHGEPNNWHKQDPLLSLPEGRVRAERMWTELSATLNGVPGERKPADKWKKVWVDWKCKTKKKMLTEGMDSLSAYGRRVMAIAGHSGKPAVNNDGEPASQNASQSASLSNTSGFHLEFEVSDEEMAERTDRTDRTERTPAIYKHIEIENKVRSSYQQFAAMLEYMERHGDLVYWNMLKREAMWAELTTILNSLPGFTKTEEKWKKVYLSLTSPRRQRLFTDMTCEPAIASLDHIIGNVWADWKCKTKRKVMKSGLEKLTDAEKRVLTVIGRGSRCDNSDSDAPNTSEPKGVYLELNSNSSDDEMAQENKNLNKIERELKRYGQEVRAKANAPQHLMLLEYMEKHGHPSVWCKEDGQADQLWAELAEKLNAVPGGVEKTVEKWKKAWADWKSKTKKKLRTLGPNHLSEYEVRVLTFAGRQWPGHKLGAVQLDEDGNEITSQSPQDSQSDVVTTELYMELSEEEMESEEDSDSSDDDSPNYNERGKRRRPKYTRTTVQQHTEMLKFFGTHGHPNYWASLERGQGDQLWAELAETLNNCRGGSKHVEKWKRVWTDWKSKTRKKVAAIRRHGKKAGVSLTALQKRVHHIMHLKSDEPYVHVEVNEFDTWADWKSKTKKKLRTLGPNHLSEYEVRVLTFAGRQWPGHKLGAVRLDEDGNEITPQSPQESQSDVVTTELYMELSEEEMESEEDSDSSDDDSPNYNERGNRRRPKYTRTTVQQHTEMLKFFGTHGHPNYWASLERGQGDQLWAELAETLNNCRGGSKHVEKWKRVWTDWKSKTRKKVAAIRRHGKKAGVSLTALQKRVHHIMNLKSDEPYVHVEVTEFDESSQSSNAGQDEDELGNLSEAAEAMEVDSEVIISEGQTEQNQDPASQRPTIHQLASMLAYMERNGDPAHWSSRDPSRGGRLWEELTSRLNGVKGGCRRDTEAWQEIWSEWKERAKTKAEADKRLTPSEKRIMVVIRPPKKKKKKHAREHTTGFAHIQPTEDLELQEAYAYINLEC